MGQVRVSAIMAVYNAGKRAVLDRAIASITAQSISDWELIICDDGSTDATYQWLLEWAKQESRIRLLRSPHRGAASARNRCIAQSRGELVAVMDADDACTSNRLAVQACYLDAHPQCSFVGLQGHMFRQTPGDMQKCYWYCANPEPADFLMTLPFVHGSLMFRRTALMQVKGYDEGRHVMRSEDYDMLLRMYVSGLRGANVTDATYFIREDANTYRRRKYRYRMIESFVKLRGFRRLGMMPRGMMYALKPLVVGIIPIPLLEAMKKRYYAERM